MLDPPQSLQRRLCRWCSQMLDPPQSLHLLLRRWCSQNDGTAASVFSCRLSSISSLFLFLDACLTPWSGGQTGAGSVSWSLSTWNSGSRSRSTIPSTCESGNILRQLAVLIALRALAYATLYLIPVPGQVHQPFAMYLILLPSVLSQSNILSWLQSRACRKHVLE